MSKDNQTQEKPTTPSGDTLDGTGQDNQKGKDGKSPQQEFNDEDHG